MPTQVLDSAPSLLGLYSRALLKKPHAGHWPAQLGFSLAGVRAGRARVRNYSRVCHFDDNRFLPPTYLHVMAFPLHMRLITEPLIPLAPLGLVHVRNTIRQFRPVAKEELLHIECALGEMREEPVGLEFDLHTRIHAGGELVCEGVSTNLKRHRSPVPSGEKKQPPPLHSFEVQQTWSLASGLGRQYGASSGDRNPIHLWPLTARLFGFKRHIAHGMWTKARCLAALMPPIDGRPFEIKVAFKTPVYLPADVEFSYSPGSDEIPFLLRAPTGRPHLQGAVTFL